MKYEFCNKVLNVKDNGSNRRFLVPVVSMLDTSYMAYRHRLQLLVVMIQVQNKPDSSHQPHYKKKQTLYSHKLPSVVQLAFLLTGNPFSVTVIMVLTLISSSGFVIPLCTPSCVC